MSLRPYPEYKDSGVAWLGDVPEGWEVCKLGYGAKLQGGYAFTSTDFGNEGVPIVRMANLNRGRLNLVEAVRIPDRSKNPSVSLNEGDLVWGMSGSIGETGSLGNFAVVMAEDTPCQLNQRVGRFLCNRNKINTNFLTFWIQSDEFYKQILLHVTGTAQFNVSSEQVQNTIMCLPDFIEQSAIAAFLDRETGKIDALIAEQEKLIVLLAEKRQATISHAVTKGLNPDAPLKDSGVEWLGQIPAHWEATPLKYVCLIGNGSTPNRDNLSYWDDGSFPWLNSSVVNQDIITEADQFVTQLAMAECHLPVVKPPAVLVGITGQGRTRGMAATLNVEATINQHVAFLKANQALLTTPYLRRAMDMSYARLRFESDEGGSTKGALTCKQLGDFDIPLPPVPEQGEIVDFLSSELLKLEALFNEANRVIDLLKERRTALISAAVTGKIDVRPSADIIPFPIEKRLARGLISIGIIEGFVAANSNTGRTTLQKTAYFCEAWLGVSEIAGRYMREMRGPFDREMIEDMEQQAHQLAGIITEQPKGTGGIVTYRLSQHLGGKDAELKAMLGEERYEDFKKLIRLLAPLDTHAIEGVATLFAVWNDFLIDGKDPSKDDIIEGVLKHWHPKKAEEFTAHELLLRLEWMRRYELVPLGRGPKTETGRLFV